MRLAANAPSVCEPMASFEEGAFGDVVPRGTVLYPVHDAAANTAACQSPVRDGCAHRSVRGGDADDVKRWLRLAGEPVSGPGICL